ncbi:hypothetical protein LNU06_00190 [Campylobacter sp. VicNov18]|uniref:hypothetical protein n=1 Tax=Campylobacter bilis TaxID=2691918 RepID=UPI00130E96C1|nr:hypothetical protein [Campylobacter bilis]MPV62964.1 hypothetical protein [Campylobacter hepaticus]MBM0636463.1 hypothetical protein [Campylobacter bilis]MCC8277172.1 hypothetical protein [Campylobacter bilis]MCC8298915.1 hypothetical protein [Campylobacter bilis]MCC8300081.1 hypothetical protein [Campylobacter bilis]
MKACNTLAYCGPLICAIAQELSKDMVAKDRASFLEFGFFDFKFFEVKFFDLKLFVFLNQSI